MTPRSWYGVLLLLVACRAAPDHATELQVTVDSSGPYPIVRSFGDAPTRSAIPVAVVGSSDAPHEFGRPRSALLSDEGDLYVADPSYRAIFVFDSAGQFIRQIGRDGAGPGEYRDPYSLAWIDRRLALLDPGNARIGFYEPSGSWVSSRSVQPITGGQQVRLYRTPPTFWAYAVRVTADGSETVFVQHTLDGPADTLPLIRPATGTAPGRRCDRPDGGITFFSAPYGAAALQIPTSEGFRVLALTSHYRIAFISAGGDTARVLEREVEPVPVSDAEWSERNADWVRFREAWPTATCDRGEFPRPAVKPPLVFLFFDDVGRLWVELITPSGTRYDVFDRTGRLHATVTGLPATGGVDPSVAGDRIAMVGRDSDDVPVVRLFRVVLE